MIILAKLAFGAGAGFLCVALHAPWEGVAAACCFSFVFGALIDAK